MFQGGLLYSYESKPEHCKAVDHKNQNRSPFHPIYDKMNDKMDEKIQKVY